jgi:hypothetical protein
MSLTFKQAACSTAASPTTPTTKSFAGFCTSGSILFCTVLLASSGAAASVTGISDPTNGSWTKLVEQDNAGSRVYLYYFTGNTAVSMLTVSVAFSGTGTLLNIGIAEYTGQSTTFPPIDGTASFLDLTGTSYTGSPITTKSNNETVLAFGYSSQSSGSITGTNGFTSRITPGGGPSTDGAALLDSSNSSQGTYTPTCTLSISNELDLATVAVYSTTSTNPSTASSSWLTAALANGLRGVRH